MVTVKIFGTLRLDSGVREFTVSAHNVKELYPLIMQEIQNVNPQCQITERDFRSCMVAVKGKEVSHHAKLNDGDEVWFLQPIAGG